ncbi:M14 family metallopeptidase [Sutcliffiella cohnii]|uniref:succinylglutamate desuccinylase/aspartoacylase family protein n=1 Tax=Sutcliffiella cohnii TaxID=33932 RepID=UPI002E1AB724|nr:M14 family metallopeptidase [Sutcliffiella cohnii]
MKNIGTAKVIPGEKTEGYLHAGTDIDGASFKIPLLVAAGKEEGPTIWVHGCIHGDEFGGAASIIRFFEELNVQELRGTFVGVPVTNLPSFKGWSRISPLDGANLNRIFPGNPKGTYSQRLAHLLLSTIKETADYVLDLHSGGLALHVDYFMICKGGDSDAAQKSLWLAERMGSKVIWVTEQEGSVGGTITDHVMEFGIPNVTIEVGGGHISEKHEHQFKDSIKNAMKALELLPGDAPVQKEYEIYRKGDFIFAGEGGLFVPASKVGSILNKGDLIGTIINLHGKVVEEIRCSDDNAYLAATGHPYWPTEQGRLIAETYTK